MKAVKEDENYSVGGQNEGYYTMQPGFGIMIVSATKDKKRMEALFKTIPHFDDFKKYKVVQPDQGTLEVKTQNHPFRIDPHDPSNYMDKNLVLN